VNRRSSAPSASAGAGLAELFGRQAGLGRVGRRHRAERGRPDEGRAGADPRRRALLVEEREGGDLDGLGRVARRGRCLEVDDDERGCQESRIFGQAAHGATVRVGSPAFAVWHWHAGKAGCRSARRLRAPTAAGEAAHCLCG
jgi:hypothetical protein